MVFSLVRRPKRQGQRTDIQLPENLPEVPKGRTAIGKAIEAELGQRLGVNQHSKEDVENFPPPTEGKTRDLAAKAAGFGTTQK